MLKSNNLIPICSVAVILIIISVSITETLVKLLLALFSITFLFPNFRDKLIENNLRKIKVAFYTSVIFTLGWVLFFNNQLFAELLSLGFLFIFFFFFITLVILLYGLPVSVIAEIVSIRFNNIRFLLSGLIHIGFGLFTYFIEPNFIILATSCSIIYFLLDELTRRKYKET